jgi:hypothetical protein
MKNNMDGEFVPKGIVKAEMIHTFISLYPAVMKYCAYPLGHPQIIAENFDHKKKKNLNV